ncbi:hypothetical protein K8941_03035 [Buchnera aphidicola (Sitobion miscanthi)]|nr:hypothetical protein [Buchnera aphidicola]MCU4137297.1 hypothetical protein [Buchnera aphidicola (Sitobion miscanthi)]
MYKICDLVIDDYGYFPVNAVANFTNDILDNVVYTLYILAKYSSSIWINLVYVITKDWTRAERSNTLT